MTMCGSFKTDDLGSVLASAKSWEVKSAECYDGPVFFAEEVGNPREWKYMTPDEAAKLGGVGTVIGPVVFEGLSGNTRVASALPDVVADPQDDGDMQAAIGAAHVEDESVSADFITLGGEAEADDGDATILREGETSKRIDETDTEEFVSEAAKQVRANVQASKDGKTAGFLLITYNDGDDIGLFGNLHPVAALKAVELYGLRRMGLPAELVDLLGDASFSIVGEEDEYPDYDDDGNLRPGVDN